MTNLNKEEGGLLLKIKLVTSLLLMTGWFILFSVSVLAQDNNLASEPDLVQIEQTPGASLTQAPADYDQDGYSDETEIKQGYSPFNAEPVKAEKSDIDKDGLSDAWEIKFKTDALNSDSDGDGFLDGLEVDLAYDPMSSSTKKLSQKIEINLKKQQLAYLVAGQTWKTFSVSTGKAAMPTPKGSYKIINKNKKAWSKSYGLWMPYWMGLGNGQFGMHELPVWPSGYREGEDHLGKPVSHGCIRLGVGSAQYIYDRVVVGTEVTIK